MSRRKSLFRQCSLENREGSWQTSYLPVRFAVEGSVLRLRDAGTWSDGWRVTGVYGEPMERPDPRKAIRQHRERTGDADPK